MERTGALPTVPPPKGARKRKSDPGAVFQGQGGDWLLTTAEKKRILLNNIYGVDIDQQAVEVTKLSLLLRVLEDENQDTLNKQLMLWRERALPDLGGNIKCGNSLIGPDFFDGQLLPDEEEVRRVNPFDWQAEFPEIMKAGGFDAVIGNPPYVRQEILGQNFKNYAQKIYEAFAGAADLYVYFIEKSHGLLKPDGLFGIICSNKFVRSNYGKGIRNFLARRATLLQLIDFGELPVFQNAATFPIIVLSRNGKTEQQRFVYAPIKRLDFPSLEKEAEEVGSRLDEAALQGDNWTLAHGDELAVFEKMRGKGLPLGDYIQGKVYRGIITGLNDAFVIDSNTRETLIAEDEKSAELIKPFAVGDNVRKYSVDTKNRHLIFTRRGLKIGEFPAIKKHLEGFKDHLTPKPKGWKGDKWRGRKPGSYEWYEIQDTVDYFEVFERPKIVYPDIAKESRFSLDATGTYFGNTVYVIDSNSLYLLGVLNAKLIYFYFKRIASVLGDADRGGRLRWFTQDVVKIPIRTIDFDDPADRARHDRMVSLVDQMLALHKELPAATTDHEQNLIRRRIEATDRQIDALVYELYGLTPEEIAVVEESVR